MAAIIKPARNVPELRFPGFSGGWQSGSLKDIAIFTKGTGLSKEEVISDGKNLCIRYGELYTRYNEIIKQVFSRTNVEKKVGVLSHKGDLLLPSSGESPIDIAKASYLTMDGVLIGGDINIIRLNDGFSGKFFAYYLTHFKRREIARLGQGYSVVHLYGSHLKKVVINSPSFEEQQKIGETLSTIDDWIEILKKQKEALKKFKKGVMQMIFSQKVRFKNENGKEFPDWEEKKLGELFSECDERAGETSWDLLSVGLDSGVTKHDSSIKKDSSSDDKKNYKVVRAGDIVYNTMRMWQGAAGKSDHEGIVSPAYTVVRLLNGDTDFFACLFKQPSVVHSFYRYSQGLTSDTWNLKYRHFCEVPVRIPIAWQEQNKISVFLKTIDDLIVDRNSKSTKALEWKKGLLQKMLV